MRNKLYHREVWFPKWLEKKLTIGHIKLQYSEHAKRAAHSDRYGLITLPESINVNDGYIFEAEASGKNLVKLVVRHSFNHQLDITYVILLNGTVKTVWLNHKNDVHRTLDRSQYERET